MEDAQSQQTWPNSTDGSSKAAADAVGGGKAAGAQMWRRRSSLGSTIGEDDEPGIWAKLLSRKDPASVASLSTDDDLSFGEEGGRAPAGPLAAAAAATRGSAAALTSLGRTLGRHPVIPLVSLAVLGACLAVGLTLVVGEADKQEKCMIDTATMHAKEAMEWFSDEFDRALAPLFALAQVVKHDEPLCALGKRIGNRGEPGALPGWPDEEKNHLLRDVRGVCDNVALLDRFAGIADSIKRDSGLGKVISGLRVAPAGVMCMIHPVINYDDYDHIVPQSDATPYYNGTKWLYNDWAWDYAGHIDVLRKTYRMQEAEENRITITGPFKMKSFTGDGTILTDTLFCTHLGVTVPNHTVTMIGENMDDPPETYNSWGFVMGFVNWNYMVENSLIGDRFDKLQMVYELNRTQDVLNRTTGEITVKSDAIAWSDHECSVHDTKEEGRVVLESSVNGDNWILTAGYTCSTRPEWEFGAKFAVVAASVVISVLALLVLVKNQQHKDLLYKMMPKRAIKKLNRGQTVVEKYSMVTVFFSDIVGFTSMAGEMRPVEVMKMLNALYVQFDKLTKKHNCYKVETIGDAYMVVGGCPDRCSRAEAAAKVALFALDAIECVKSFEYEGANINIRAGLASGSVVAGVVGNVMPRYCLFGDTVNFASRMESTSRKMKLQVCDSTKQLLMEAPSHRFEVEIRRDSKDKPAGVMVKGKGWKETWWLLGASVRSGQDSKLSSLPFEVDIFSAQGEECHPSPAFSVRSWDDLGQELYETRSNEAGRIEQVITLLGSRLSDLMASRSVPGTEGQELPTKVSEELTSLVSKISSLYNDVPFHNFDHACHVTISANKLLDMSATARGQIDYSGWHWSNEMISFAMVFAALVHDVGHLGMTNKMLVESGHDLADKYGDKSVAECNSLDVATDLLKKDDFSHLRAAAFGSDEEMKVFLLFVRVAVSATDIASKDNMRECKELKECAFDIDQEQVNYHAFNILAENDLLDAGKLDSSFKLALCRCCSLLQHLIQAADVSHSMQSFQVSILWNFRLFKELYACFSSDLLPADPSAWWATGEVGFFDNYVQPLASRLCEISSTDSEKLSVLSRFAKENHDQWEKHGRNITEIMAKSIASGQDEDATIASILSACNIQGKQVPKVSWGVGLDENV